jgi:dihydropteroate synthase
MLVGISRKRFLWEPLGIRPEEALPATQTAHLAALQGGADILRVHDVAPAVQAVGVYRQLAGAGV